MLHMAHASVHHWLQVGTPANHQRGFYLLAVAYAALGLGERALHYAARCRALTEAHPEAVEDWDRAFALEGAARAHAAAGNREEAARLKALARAAGDAIADEEDRRAFDQVFAGGEWHGVA
jgi:hypothetical protein